MNYGLALTFCVIMCGLLAFAVKVDRMHTDGLLQCTAANGVWIDRQMMCITGKDLKVVNP